jgi:hydrogenase maturation protease
MNTSPRVEVIGVGCLHRADDGVGPAVMNAVRAHLPDGCPGLRLTECPGDPAGLIGLWENARLAVVIDACFSRPGRAGEITRTELSPDGRLFASPGPRHSTHGLGLSEAMSSPGCWTGVPHDSCSTPSEWRTSAGPAGSPRPSPLRCPRLPNGSSAMFGMHGKAACDGVSRESPRGGAEMTRSSQRAGRRRPDDAAVLGREGIGALVRALRERGRTVVGPTVRDVPCSSHRFGRPTTCHGAGASRRRQDATGSTAAVTRRRSRTARARSPGSPSSIRSGSGSGPPTVPWTATSRCGRTCRRCPTTPSSACVPAT